MKSLNRCLELFPYHSQWIPEFSDRIKPIAGCKSVPLSQPAVEAFESLTKTIEDAIVTATDKSILFEVETDASEVALAATLNQNGRPVAFFSRTLNPFPTKDVYICPPWCHATTKDVYIRPHTNGIAQSPVVRYCLNTFTPVVEKSLALIFEDR